MILITGSGGLIGYTASNFFLNKKFNVIGIDNNMREKLFGKNSSVKDNILSLKKNKKYKHLNIDINNLKIIYQVLQKKNVRLIVHAAGQPSHDWSALDPISDFKINALSTLNLLEGVRKYSPKTIFIFLSTNKVYGDYVNNFNYIEEKSRFIINIKKHKNFLNGFGENIPIDQSLHSPFGVSKISADIMTQEYGKYYGLSTICLRAGCLTGENHTGTELHGFLSYLFKCAFYGKKYFIYGYKGKQVRDNLSAYDVTKIIYEILKKPPKCGEVYNIGGGIQSNISIIEAIKKIENILEKKIKYKYINKARKGDHIYWVTNMKKFKNNYPSWNINNTIDDILLKMYEYEKSTKSSSL